MVAKAIVVRKSVAKASGFESRSGHHRKANMKFKKNQKFEKPPLEGKVRVSDSGQFTVSIDAIRQLPTFSRDVKAVAKIREILEKRK